MLPEETVTQQLRQAGYRITRPRRAVIRVLLADEAHLSPAEVHERAKRHCATVGLVTVYRTLDILAEMGLVQRIHAEDGCHSYVTTSKGHHHHLICRQCGSTLEFEGCNLGELCARISQDTGYVVEQHLLELVGLCATCR